MKVLFRYVDRMSKIKLRCSQISLLPWRSLFFLWWLNHPVHSKDPDQRTAPSNFFYYRWITECLVATNEHHLTEATSIGWPEMSFALWISKNNTIRVTSPSSASKFPS